MSGGWDGWSRVYRILEYTLHGRSLERARFEAISHLPPEGTVLLLGDGDGRFLAEVLRRPEWAKLRFVSVDLSGGMIECARARAGEGSHSRVRWIQEDLRSAAARLPQGPFAAVVTQFFFDCFTDAEIAQWWPAVAARVAPGGTWIVTDYTAPARLRGGRQMFQRWLVQFLYFVFARTTSLSARCLPEVEGVFASGQWARVGGPVEASKTTVTDCWRKPCGDLPLLSTCPHATRGEGGSDRS